MGIITRGDLVRALLQDPSGKRTLLDAGSSKPVVAFADEPLNEAISRMLKKNIGRLPVVSRENQRCIVGYIGRSNVMAARLRGIEEEEVRERGELRKLLPIQLKQQTPTI